MDLTLAEAETQLPRLIRAALAGDEAIIADQGRASVRLVPVHPLGEARRPGAWAALPPLAEDWDDPAFQMTGSGVTSARRTVERINPGQAFLDVAGQRRGGHDEDVLALADTSDDQV
jgi:antitoxin (DNA-binding transcriptional repressor) of toxin-antitoxin stability system